MVYMITNFFYLVRLLEIYVLVLIFFFGKILILLDFFFMLEPF